MSSAFEQLAEQRIEQAIQDGLFDDLSGSGVAIDLDGYLATPSHLRMCHSLLKSGGHVPAEVELMQSIHHMETILTNSEDPRQSKALQLQISHKKAELAMAMERIQSQVRQQNQGNQS